MNFSLSKMQVVIFQGPRGPPGEIGQSGNPGIGSIGPKGEPVCFHQFFFFPQVHIIPINIIMLHHHFHLIYFNFFFFAN